MKKRFACFITLLALVAIIAMPALNRFHIAEAAGGSLTTIYQRDSGLGNVGSGMMFDVSALSNDIQIDYFETHSDETATVDVSVFYKSGSYVGFETNSAAWTFLGSTTVTFSGLGNIVQVNVGTFTIPAGQTYGIYMRMDTGDSIVVMANGSNTYSNSDIQIDTGTGLSMPWGAFNIYPNYTWNGTIYYTIVPLALGYQASGDYAKIGQIRVTAPGTALYEEAAGNVVRDAGGAEMWVPNQTADDPTQDTYDVLAQTTVGDVTWVEIFVGDANFPVWVPVGGGVQIISLVE